MKGKVAAVTGGTKGIGAAIARALLGEGAKVFICGRDAGLLAEALEKLGPLGEVKGTTCDVSLKAKSKRC